MKEINPNDLKDFDLLTGGFPCQSFSVAGKGKGELDTRGTLFHEIIRIAEVKKPRYMLLENVKGLTNNNHRETFEKILSELKRIGYNVKVKVLNSKEHGIPQNRERVWFVCFRELEDFKQFKWPEPVPLKIFLKDILEDAEEERYELNTKDPKVVGCALRTWPRNNKDAKNSPERGKRVEARKDEVSNAITTHQNDSMVACIDGYNKKVIEDGTTITITEGLSHGHLRLLKDGTIRKLTPKECFRLMGFLNDEIKLDGLSDTQRYKLAGNGQDVNMVSLIFMEMKL